MRETVDLLKKNDLFKGFDGDELNYLASLVRQRHVLKGVFIIKEGDVGSEMYLVKSGEAKVMLNNVDGKELVLSTIQEGEIFGEMSLLDDDPRSANVVALQDCTLLVIFKTDFYEFLKKNSNAAIHVIKYLCHKLRNTNRVAHAYALMDVYERLIKFLYSTAQPEPNGELIVKDLTHKEIALKICTGREVVSRMLKKLEKDGYISNKNKSFILKKELPSSL